MKNYILAVLQGAPITKSLDKESILLDKANLWND